VVTLELFTATMRSERLQRLSQQADVAPLHPLHLVYFSPIDVEMSNAFRVPSELRGHTGDAVIEACADSDEEITVIHGVVRERGTVHSSIRMQSASVVSTDPMPIKVVTTGILNAAANSARALAAPALITPPPA